MNKYLENIDTDDNEIFVPDYQREFTWDEERQSKFIESIILDLPVPLIFLAETQSGRLEIVDGSQRIRTVAAFLQNDLTLCGLLNLTYINGLRFCELAKSRQRKIKNTSLKTIVLRDDTTERVKNDIFERINRGSDPLYAMEKRKGIFRGRFNDFIYQKCAQDELFRKLTPLAPLVVNRQEHEELILRFFALYDAYPQFSFTSKMGIATYLDNYLDNMNRRVEKEPEILEEKYKLFDKMIHFVDRYYPHGFTKHSNAKQVSRIYFEAISVGTALALTKCNGNIPHPDRVKNWIDNGQLIEITMGKYRTHNKQRIKERIDFVYKKLTEK